MDKITTLQLIVTAKDWEDVTNAITAQFNEKTLLGVLIFCIAFATPFLPSLIETIGTEIFRIIRNNARKKKK